MKLQKYHLLNESLGAIHLRRRQIFQDFWPLPPTVGNFLLLSVGKFGKLCFINDPQFAINSTPKSTNGTSDPNIISKLSKQFWLWATAIFNYWRRKLCQQLQFNRCQKITFIALYMKSQIQNVYRTSEFKIQKSKDLHRDLWAISGLLCVHSKPVKKWGNRVQLVRGSFVPE